MEIGEPTVLLPSLLCHLVYFCPGYLERRTSVEELNQQSGRWEGVTDDSEGRSQKCHTNTPSHAPSQDSRCTRTDFTRLKAVAFEGGRRRERYSQTGACVCGGGGVPPRACGCECAARHATARLRFLYLMQHILTVVLNGIKEGKVYRELWAQKARKEGKRKRKRRLF